MTREPSRPVEQVPDDAGARGDRMGAIRSTLIPTGVRRAYPLLVALALESCLVLYLVLGHRGLAGHDGYQYFGLQYWFLSNAAHGGETANWMPLITHGTVSNWWYGVQAGMLQASMLALGPLNAAITGVNFLPVYYAGILVDLTTFILGVWLLGRRYYRSRLTILFVLVLVLGSTPWFTQVWYNLHLFSALPLLLHFVHCLLETGRWRYFLLAGNLFALQVSCGALPYFAPITALVVASYASLYIAFSWDRCRGQVGRLFSNAGYALLPLVLVCLSLGCAFLMLSSGVDEVTNYNVGRALDGRSESVESFLTYGTNSNARWLELVTRFSPALDYSVYIGYAGLAFALLALTTRPDAALRAVLGTALVVLLLANATPFARLLYHVWPMMAFFRHLSLLSPLVRTLLCFVAGFGFERLLLQPQAGPRGGRARQLWTFALLGGLALVLSLFSRTPLAAAGVLLASVAGSLPLDATAFVPARVQAELGTAALWCSGAALLFALAARARPAPRWLALCFLAYQAADVYAFKYGLARTRTVRLTPEQYAVSELQPVPYSQRRLPVDYRTHPRARHVPQNEYQVLASAGFFYSTVGVPADSYLFIDPPVNVGRADHWLRSFDDFLRAYWGDPWRDYGRRPSFSRPWSPLAFPYHRSPALKLAGVTEDKIQFFATAHPVREDREIAAQIAAPSFSGDVLYVSGPAADGPLPPPTSNERRRRPYSVLRYGANGITIRADAADRGEWLYYADAWHPSWRAEVNGRRVSVSKANLGYKAVPLDQGQNVVEFRFHAPVAALCMQALNWNSLIWLLLVVRLVLVELGRSGEGT